MIMTTEKCNEGAGAVKHFWSTNVSWKTGLYFQKHMEFLQFVDNRSFNTE